MNAETRKALEQRLERIRQRNGGVLTPDGVVKDARDPKSPLHEHFTWDDSLAAHQYRLDQARTLIRIIHYEVTIETRTFRVPTYARDPRVGSDEQGYCAVAELRDDKAAAVAALRYEFDRAIAQLDRMETIAYGLGVADQISDLLSQARVISENLPQPQPTKVGRRGRMARGSVAA